MGAYDDLIPKKPSTTTAPEPAASAGGGGGTYSDLVPPPQRTVAEKMDRGRQAAAAGTRRGWEGVAGFVGDVPDMASGATSYLVEQANKILPESMQPDPARAGETAATIARGPGAMLVKALQAAGVPVPPEVAAAANAEAPGAQDIHEQTNKVIGETTFKPENRIESGIETAASMLPNVLGPGKGGGLMRLGTRVLAPTAALEGSDVATDELVKNGIISPDTATAIKLVATGLVGGGATALEGNPGLTAAARSLSSSPRGVQELSRVLGMTPEETLAKLKQLGGDANVMDVSPGAQASGMDVSTRPGTGKKVVQESLTGREKDFGTRTEAAREAAFGPEVNRTDTLAALKDRAAEVNTQYPAAKANQTRLASLDSIAAELDAELQMARGGMKKGLQEIRDSLDDPRVKSGDLDPTAEGLHAIRVELDRMYEAAEPGGKLQARIGDYRKRIDSELKDIAPDIKSLDEQRHQIYKEGEAFEAGEEVLTKGKTALSPREFEQTWSDLGDAEKAKMVEGASRYVDRQLGLSPNERQQLKTLFGGRWNESKLRTLVGDEKADAFMAAMEREDIFRNTYTKVVQNSRTPEALGERESSGGIFGDVAEDFTKTTGATLSPTAGAKAAGIGVVKNTLQKLTGGGAGRSEALRSELAPLLVSGRHDDLFQALMLAQQKGAVIPNAAIAALLARQEALGNR